ncbi:MAG: response regulator transcription factor [Blastocatellia bacterium]|nr:response regulator transcription factor [Blastocatellia bacterium]
MSRLDDRIAVSRTTRQRIRYLRTTDGVQLAWAEAGTGPVLVKAANWLSHLDYDWESPVWHHWIRFFCRSLPLHSLRRTRLRDDGLEGRRPDVRAMARGSRGGRGRRGRARAVRAAGNLAGRGGVHRLRREAPRPRLAPGAVRRICAWRRATQRPREGTDLPRADRTGASRVGNREPGVSPGVHDAVHPDGTDEQMTWFNELCRKTTSPEIAAELLEARAEIYVTGLLGQVRVPTLVLHARDDAVVPIAEGRLLASGIDGAQFVELDSKNHVLLAHEPAWERFCEAVLEFVGLETEQGRTSASGGEDPAFAGLTRREREVLALIAHGLGNAEIAGELKISEKTVRNHVSNVFDKLGVWTRAQAIVFAHERGFVR